MANRDMFEEVRRENDMMGPALREFMDRNKDFRFPIDVVKRMLEILVNMREEGISE